MSNAPLVLIGSRGMLGRAFFNEFARRGRPFTPLNREQLDLSKPEDLALAIPPRTRIVINCAAWTNVDKAEEHEAEATMVNGEGLGALAHTCAEMGAILVNYGTDYVFRGDADKPYRTTEKRSPINAYGRSKAAGEAALHQSGCDYLQIRTSWLYAPWGTNFVRTINKTAHEKPVLKVVNDQRGRPTSAEHLARTTLALLDEEATGIYHVTDGGECTWFEFAQEIVRLSNAPAKVEPCTTADFPRPAKRPAYSVLDISQTEEVVGPMPHWKTNLADVMKRLET
ncbi:MAG TPA: dTDP-4-dehydrorhamnose reductase [Phycisphaerales bacterium]|nr:dTDP-4-dehydrorhamnose reductase [Phycisphaerales bacterium]